MQRLFSQRDEVNFNQKSTRFIKKKYHAIKNKPFFAAIFRSYFLIVIIYFFILIIEWKTPTLT